MKAMAEKRGTAKTRLLRGMRALLTLALLLTVALPPLACRLRREEGRPGQRRRLVVLTPHGQEMLDEYEKAFEAAHPDIDVVGRFVPTGQILAQLRVDRARPTVDVWWGGTSAFFEQANEEKLLAPYHPTWAQASPPGRHALDDAWYAQFLELPAILYNRNIYQDAQIPATWDGLLAPAWAGKIVIREPLDSGTMRTIFAGIIWLLGGSDHNPQPGYDFLKRLDAQTQTYLPNPQALYDRIAKSPEGLISLWNLTDIIYQSRANGYPFGYKLPLGPLPVGLDPIAITAGAPHPAEAREFYEFVTDKQNCLKMAREHYRIPARSDIPFAELPDWQQQLNYTVLELDRATFDKLEVEWLDHWRTAIRDPKK